MIRRLPRSMTNSPDLGNLVRVAPLPRGAARGVTRLERQPAAAGDRFPFARATAEMTSLRCWPHHSDDRRESSSTRSRTSFLVAASRSTASRSGCSTRQRTRSGRRAALLQGGEALLRSRPARNEDALSGLLSVARTNGRQRTNRFASISLQIRPEQRLNLRC